MLLISGVYNIYTPCVSYVILYPDLSSLGIRIMLDIIPELIQESKVPSLPFFLVTDTPALHYLYSAILG